MLHVTEAIKFLEQQSQLCVDRSVHAKTDEMWLKYSVCADVYMTIASVMRVLTVGVPLPISEISDLEKADRVSIDE